MSKVKNPQEKKRKSLELDRRNCFGESPHASRKNIARSKRIQHQQERRAANGELPQLLRSSSADDFALIEGRLKARALGKRLSGFKKDPDRPLAQVLARKAQLRVRQQSIKSSLP